MAKANKGERFCFFSFSAKDTNVESLFFLGHFWPRFPKMKVCFSWSFLAKDNNGESFSFWAFLAKDANGESFWARIPTVKALFFLGHFWPRLPTVKVFVFHGHFWPRLLLLTTSAMNTNDESYVCDLRFWATSGIPLYQTQVRIRWRQSLAPHCASRSLRSARQLLAWDGKYTRTPVGKRWHESMSISYPRMERVKKFSTITSLHFPKFLIMKLHFTHCMTLGK